MATAAYREAAPGGPLVMGSLLGALSTRSSKRPIGMEPGTCRWPAWWCSFNDSSWVSSFSLYFLPFSQDCFPAVKWCQTKTSEKGDTNSSNPLGIFWGKSLNFQTCASYLWKRKHITIHGPRLAYRAVHGGPQATPSHTCCSATLSAYTLFLVGQY